jgi:hypothetical protein
MSTRAASTVESRANQHMRSLSRGKPYSAWGGESECGCARRGNSPQDASVRVEH